jgi:hypothetical protein
MSNYVKATNFAIKDGLASGNPSKIIKGTEIDSEFTAIASAVSSKADSNSPTFTGTPVAPTASAGTNTTQVATTAFVTTAVSSTTAITSAITAERTASATLTNKTISVDDNVVSGIAAASFVLSNSSGVIDGSAGQKAIPSGAVVGTSDSQTLTNKSINASQLVNASISAAKLDGAQSGSAPIYAARAWVNFNGTGSVAIRASGNVSSLSDNGTGDYTVNFTTALPTADYVSAGMSAYITNLAGNAAILYEGDASGNAVTKTTTQARVVFGNTFSGGKTDAPLCLLMFLA